MKFLSVFFGPDGAQNSRFLKKITNQMFPLNYSQLICEHSSAKRKKKRMCIVTVNSKSIATTLFSPLKVLRFNNQSLD